MQQTTYIDPNNDPDLIRLKAIGFILRLMRKLKGISQTDAGEALGYHHTAISNYELGKYAIKNDDLDRLLSFYLGVGEFDTSREKETKKASERGDLLKRLREIAGVSQTEVAHDLGIDNSTISNYETGARNIPDDRLEEFLLYCLLRAQEQSAQVVNKTPNGNRSNDELATILLNMVSGIEGRLNLISDDDSTMRDAGVEALTSDLHIMRLFVNKFLGSES